LIDQQRSKKLMKKFEFFNLKINDSPGKHVLTVAELKDYIDFDVKRVYIISDFKIKETGQHCHYEEKEFFSLVKGSVTAVIDKGQGIEEFPMTPGSAIYVPNYVWHGFKDISEDAVILALSSTNYRPDRSDYLDNYDEYLKIRDEKLTANS
jgi:mannose-6-phosphate isomerase-like protein (cupin superfamily)